jgi:hypothetical protein
MLPLRGLESGSSVAPLLQKFVSHAKRLKPAFILALYAALKRRSSTVLPAYE